MNSGVEVFGKAARVDETYVKVKKVWMYLYRAVDSQGNTLEFLLSPTRDAHAAKYFFAKALAAPHTSTPRVITVDKNAAYPKAFKELKAEGTLPDPCELRQSKYLNNHVEQDHRFMKRLVKLGMGFFSFETAWRTLEGYEAMNMLRKGQIHFDDLQGEKSHGLLGFGAYSQAKLANVMFTYDLPRRLEGTGITVNAVGPFFVGTNFGVSNGGTFGTCMRCVMRFAQTPADAARTAIRLASAPEMQNATGKFYSNEREIRSSKLSHNVAIQTRLWEVSEKLTQAPVTI